jgi:hypothetical protein
MRTAALLLALCPSAASRASSGCGDAFGDDGGDSEPRCIDLSVFGAALDYAAIAAAAAAAALPRRIAPLAAWIRMQRLLAAR